MNRNRILTAAGAILAAAVVLAPPLLAERTPYKPPVNPAFEAWKAVPSTKVTAGMTLKPTESWKSPDGKYALRYQKNGQLGLYEMNGTSTPPRIWTSGTTALPVGFAQMQADGLFVCRGADNALTWSTNSKAVAGAILVVRDDGDVAILGPLGGVLWARTGGSFETLFKSGPAQFDVGIAFG